MKNKLIITSVIIIFVILGLTTLLYLRKPKEVHYHAGFQVYLNGKLQEFSDYKYMSFIPCNDKNGKKEDEQLEKAHLHDGVGDVVHVHRDNATWEDLFKNIKFTIDPTQLVIGYVNGKEINNILQQKIQPYDTLVLFIGKHDNTNANLKRAVTKQHIQQVEKTSELCGN